MLTAGASIAFFAIANESSVSAVWQDAILGLFMCVSYGPRRCAREAHRSVNSVVSLLVNASSFATLVIAVTGVFLSLPGWCFMQCMRECG